jgi:hypothetical protein
LAPFLLIGNLIPMHEREKDLNDVMGATEIYF